MSDSSLVAVSQVLIDRLVALLKEHDELHDLKEGIEANPAVNYQDEATMKEWRDIMARIQKNSAKIKHFQNLIGQEVGHSFYEPCWITMAEAKAIEGHGID